MNRRSTITSRAAVLGFVTALALAHAGIFVFQVPVAARYRVSITSRHWIDIVDGDIVVSSLGPTDRVDLVHKIVEFDLPFGRPLTLQLSGQDHTIVGFAITLVPI